MVKRLAVLAMLALYGCATTQTAQEEVGPPKPERAEWIGWPKDTGGRIATTTMLAFGAWLLVNFLEGPDGHTPGTVTPGRCPPDTPVPCL